jgi:hypothetical protein
MTVTWSIRVFTDISALILYSRLSGAQIWYALWCLWHSSTHLLCNPKQYEDKVEKNGPEGWDCICTKECQSGRHQFRGKSQHLVATLLARVHTRDSDSAASNQHCVSHVADGRAAQWWGSWHRVGQKETVCWLSLWNASNQTMSLWDTFQYSVGKIMNLKPFQLVLVTGSQSCEKWLWLWGCHVRLSVQMEELGSYWTGFRDFCIWKFY